MPYEICRHIKVSGKRCKSPCLSGESFCFFHTRIHFRHRVIRSAKPIAAPTPLVLPVIEDRESVQVAASLIIAAIAAGHLDDKRAASLLRALQVASRNLGGLSLLEPAPENTVRSFFAMPEGIEVAPRSMSDNSTPPARESNPRSAALDSI